MNLLYALQTAFDNLRANKLRSLLTMLGVIIGVGAVIVMVAIVQGASARVTNEFESMGSGLIIIFYDADSKDKKATTRRIDGMTMEDVRTIEDECTQIVGISAELQAGAGTARRGAREIAVTPNGVQPAYEKLRNLKLARGRFVSETDMNEWAKVCIIGDKVRAALFPDSDPLGQIIQYGSLNLMVVGVMEKKGRSLEGDADKAMYMPLSTMQKRIVGKDLVGAIWAVPKDPKQINPTMEQIWRILMRRYNNLPGFHVDSQESILNSINTILSVFGLVLGSIASLALLVGGIGIMNIMLVSVTERTREIGVRKALGAKRKDILIQFLIESATVSGTGGIIGIICGASFAYFIGFVTQFVPGLENPQTGAKGLAIYLPVGVSIGAFCFSAFIGIFFGIWPAVRAARLDPIQALRHE